LKAAASTNFGSFRCGKEKGPSHDDRERASHSLCSGSPYGTTAIGKSKNGKREREDNTLCEENEIRKEARVHE